MSLRARIFLAFTAVIVAGFIALVYWIRDDLRPRYLESLEEPLVDTAHILAELLANDLRTPAGKADLRAAFDRAYARRFQAQVFALERDRVDLRVYVTDQRGVVIFDSARRDEGQDYSRWNDVARVLRGEYGARSSRDDPLDPEHATVYVAAPVMVEGEIAGVVSVGKPKRNVDQFVRAARQKILAAGVLAGLAVLMLGLTLTFWLTRPLEQLRQYAQAVSTGQSPALPRLSDNELGLLGRALEDMRVALEGKRYVENYVQTLTHELKGPLAAIRGAAELLQEDLPSEERKRFLENIRREVQRTQDLIERLLLQASLENRQILERREMIRLAPMLAEVCESLRPSLAVKGASIAQELPPDLEVAGDAFLLRHALANLIENAIAFSPGASHIEVSALREGSVVRLRIRDHGPGVPQYALERVFERFYSLPPPGSERKGTGLGLSFVREVAKLHHGSVRLRNHPDGGAEAELKLPAN